jgi:hypothetical protein
LHKARAEADMMGSYGEDGFYRPRSVSEKMRKGMPYSEWTRVIIYEVDVLNVDDYPFQMTQEYKFGNRNEF